MQIKYRQWTGESFHYWGFIKPGVFVAPCALNGSQENAEKNSQQFTGLYDKNKKAIYEGDILQFLYCVQGKDGGEKTIGAVQWRICSFYLRYGYGGKELSGIDGNNEICWSEEWVRCSEPRGYYKLKDFEVIGDINQHSHLIKG